MFALLKIFGAIQLMKPSGPGLLLVGRFLITVLISVLVILSVEIFYFFLVQFWNVILF